MLTKSTTHVTCGYFFGLRSLRTLRYSDVPKTTFLVEQMPRNFLHELCYPQTVCGGSLLLVLRVLTLRNRLGFGGSWTFWSSSQVTCHTDLRINPRSLLHPTTQGVFVAQGTFLSLLFSPLPLLPT